MTTVRPPAARHPVSTLSANHSGLEALTTVEPASVDCRAATPMTGRGAEEHGVVGEGDGTTVVRVEPSRVPSPGVTAILTEAEAVGGSHEHEAGTRRPREHLVDVVLDVKGRTPGGAAVR